MFCSKVTQEQNLIFFVIMVQKPFEGLVVCGLLLYTAILIAQSRHLIP